LDKSDLYVHLTNYSVQKYNDQFGKNEEGNEVSFDAFQDMLQKIYEGKHSIRTDLYDKIKYLVKVFTLAGKEGINMNERKHSFEVFGCDFLIDSNLEVILIEVNTNPGLEDSSELLKMLVGRMIDDTFRLTIDDLFDTKYSEDVLIEDFNYNNNNKDNENENDNLNENHKKNKDGDFIKCKYSSPFKVPGYGDDENLW
jgi:hypothetical protein